MLPGMVFRGVGRLDAVSEVTWVAIRSVMRRFVGLLGLVGALSLVLASAAVAAPPAELTASAGADGDSFGFSVAISAGEVAVGAPFRSGNQGAAYAFGFSDDSWPQQTEASPGAEGDEVGFDVAISGSTMVVGAREAGDAAGAVYVYTLASGSWTQRAELTASNAGSGAEFGRSVSISGSTIVVGAPGSVGVGGSPGEAYVFTGSGSDWTQQAELKPTDGVADEYFGDSVAISGSTIVIGDPESGGEVGSAYVFAGSGASWPEQTVLSASDGHGGDFFGSSVAIGGSTIAVGAYGRASYTGASYFFSGSASSWSQQAELDGSGGGDDFGIALGVSEDGSHVVVGAPDFIDPDEPMTAGPGAAYVYGSSGGSPTATLTAPDGASGDGFGYSVGISDSVEVVGALNHSSQTGAAYVFGVPSEPPAPTPVSGAATAITSSEATLNGTVNPNGGLSRAYFQYGTSTKYGATTPVQSAGSGMTPQPITATASGLNPNTTYHFRIVATASNSESYYGTDQTFTTAVAPPPPCPTSMTLGAVTVLAECITAQGNGTYLASGDTRFSDGSRIVLAGTQDPAPLIIDPAAETISIEPASGGGTQKGELESGGVDVASGELVIDTGAVQDHVALISGSALVTGVESVALSLSGWTFAGIGVSLSAYLLPSSAGGGALVDGQLQLPSWLGAAITFGAFGTIFPASVSGDLAVQVSSSGSLSVLNGGISFNSTLFGIPALRLADGQISYQHAGNVWSGVAMLNWPKVLGIDVNATIGDGKLDDLGVSFSCVSEKKCGGPPVSGSPTTGLIKPEIGAVLDLKDVSLEMINLQGISYTPFSFTAGMPIHICVSSPRFKVTCPPQEPPPPAPQIDGAIIVSALGERIIAGGSFVDLLDGGFTLNGEIGLAPLYGGHFPVPTSTNGLESTLSAAKYGINIASGSLSYAPPSTFTASGMVLLPPEVNFLRGMLSIGIDPPHFTAEGSLELIVPPGAPILGGDSLGGVQALISDEAAAGEVSAGVCLPSWLGGHCYTQNLVIAYVFSSGSFKFNLNGNINEYATVAHAASAAASGATRVRVRVPIGREFASFTVRSTKGTPDVELVSPPVHGRRLLLTLASSRRRGNHSGALAASIPGAHEETFLVAMPPGGSWTVRRLKGPKIASVHISARRIARVVPLPAAKPRASDLPKGTVSTDSRITLHYSVPNAKPGTTVELWAGTGPRGAGGVMIAHGLPPSGAATWKLTGLASGRYWPYAIVDENGIPVSIEYWPSSVEVVNPSAPAAPTGVQAAVSSGQVLVAWNEVARAETYAVTATPASGGAVVRNAVPASQLGDELTLAPGEWSIAVQAVSAEDLPSIASAAQSVTVP